MNEQERNLHEEQNADYQVYEATGSHSDIGRITALRGGGLFLAGLSTKWTPEQRTYAEQCREIVSKLFPEIINEFRGYAAALQLEEDDLLGYFSLGAIGGCSALTVRTPEGIVVTRNYDYLYYENRRHLILTRPERGLAHIGIHEGLIGGRFDGLNEKGLFVSFNGAGEHPNQTAPGVSFHLIMRYLLEKCKDAREAKEFLLSVPVKEAKSYLVVDQNDAFVAEVHTDHRAIRNMEDDILVVTNHFVHQEMTRYLPSFKKSAIRYNRLISAGADIKAAPKNADELLQQAFTDHQARTCGHVEGLATFWSCKANTASKQIKYALGAPCRNEYKQYFTF